MRIFILLFVLIACTPLVETSPIPPTNTQFPDPTPTREVWTEVPTEVFTEVFTEVPTEATCSRYSYNINGARTPRVEALLLHLIRLNPCVVLVMDNLGLANRITEETEAQVIHRTFSSAQGDEWRRISAQAQVDIWVREGFLHIVRYSTNEPSISDGNITQFLDYEIVLMEAARARRITVSVGNFGVGRMRQHWINNGIFDAWLRAVVEYEHVIGAHEYTIGVLPFGVGQWPASALIDRTQVQPSAWPHDLPTSRIEYPVLAQGADLPFGIEQYIIEETARGVIDAQAVALILPPYWHLRRGDWLLIRADEIGIERPTLILTEAFWDNMDDVAKERDVMKIRWGISLYNNDIRGAPSLVRLWSYYWPEWSAAKAACEQLQWAEETYPPEYRGFTLFTWSSSPDWVAFNLAWLLELHTMMEERQC